MSDLADNISDRIVSVPTSSAIAYFSVYFVIYDSTQSSRVESSVFMNCCSFGRC